MGRRMGSFDVEARIAVVGTGSEGCRALKNFYWGLPEVDTIAIGDGSLSDICSDRKLSLQSFGADTGNGVREDGVRREVAELLRGYDIVYVITGLDGTTGSNISPLVANVAINSGCMVASIALKSPSVGVGSISTADELRAECPMTLVVDRALVPKRIGDVDDAIRSGMVSFVREHSAKLIGSFVKNLAKDVKEAYRAESQIAVPLFANAVPN